MSEARAMTIEPGAGSNGSRIVYILRSYPRLSQTFILHELLALERLGVKMEVFAITDPREALVQQGVAEVRAPIRYLETALRRSRVTIFLEHLLAAVSGPRRYLSTLVFVLRRRDLAAGYATASRFACFLEAVYLARILRRERAHGAPKRIHSHFAHDPTLIALLLKRLTGLPYSFTTHARDLYQVPRAALAERISEATTVVTCCRSNLEYLSELAPGSGRQKLEVIRYGIDLDAFQPVQHAHNRLPLVVSIGRLVEKKGFADLVAACRLLKDRGLRFRCIVYGEGPLHEELVDAVARLDLRDEVSFAGARTQRELQAELKKADAFALTPCVTDDGDRDGVPNALLEAMACGLPVVTTAVNGIPEVVIHGLNGLMAEPHDVAAIAAHLATLQNDELLRERLGSQARQEVVANFDREANARRLAAVLCSGAGET
jgi:glycosyltransferase involved in cell wall biosynthesis